jgi:hypothetical protein
MISYHVTQGSQGKLDTMSLLIGQMSWKKVSVPHIPSPNSAPNSIGRNITGCDILTNVLAK